MTTPADATPVVAPAASVPVPVAAPAPAPALPVVAPPVTVEHISALHRHLDELASWIAQKFKEVVALVEKEAPIVGAAAAAVAPALGAAAAPILKTVETLAGAFACCGHGHRTDGSCSMAGCPCPGPAKAAV